MKSVFPWFPAVKVADTIHDKNSTMKTDDGICMKKHSRWFHSLKSTAGGKVWNFN